MFRRALKKKIRKLSLKLQGKVEIIHRLEWNDAHGRHVIQEREAIPKEALGSVDEWYIMKMYHIPWERQYRSIHNLYETWNDFSQWESVP